MMFLEPESQITRHADYDLEVYFKFRSETDIEITLFKYLGFIFFDISEKPTNLQVNLMKAYPLLEIFK